jgi:hypothetical protein
MVAKTKEALELEKENEQLRLLKIRADLLNISYHPSISFENLLNKLTESVTKASDKDFNKESPGKIARDLIDEANRLIRVRISTVNPSKKEYQGETFLVSNKYIGTVRKFVLFDQPFHAENVLVEDIKNRFYNQFITVEIFSKSALIFNNLSCSFSFSSSKASLVLATMRLAFIQ